MTFLIDLMFIVVLVVGLLLTRILAKMVAGVTHTRMLIVVSL